MADTPKLTPEELERMRGDLEAAKDAFADGKITWDEFLDLTGRATKWPWGTIWKIAAGVLVALGLMGGAATVVVKTVEPVPVVVPDDLSKVMKDGFAGLGGKLDESAKLLTGIAKKLDEKPKPDPDKDEVTIQAELEAKVGEPVFLSTKTKTVFRWIVLPDTQAHVREFGHELMIVPKADGHFRVGLVSLVKGKIGPVEWTLVKCGKGPQPPPEPKPPEPKPPEPKPEPISKGPIPVPGFRVLMVEDKEKLSLLPWQQLSIRTSKVFRDYLDANCVTEPDGKTKAYRIWDYKTDASDDLKLWRDALGRPRTSLPWIVISDYPNGGHEGPLPANTEETIQLLKKVRGN